MSTEKDSYKQIFKATSIFGGIQVFNILISIIKSKIIALLLGPAGLGIISIFNSTSALLASFTNLGINISSVKYIATASQNENPNVLPKMVILIKKLLWVTGILGLLATVGLAPWLSQVSFGNKSYTVSFGLIGISLLALQISNGQNAILQGMRKVKLIALSSLLGAFLGLIISLPLFFFFKQNGIVPALVLSTIASAITSWYFLRKVQIPNFQLTYQSLKKDGIEIIRLGFLVSLTSMLPVTAAYLLRIFIVNVGNVEDVGLYTAGFAIVGTYVGMVFSAMSTDYFPSLAAVADDNKKCEEKVNQQILMSILILAPLLVTLLVFIKLGIVILYSAKFLGIIKLIQWAALGIFFQSFSFCIAYLFLAKGHSKLFFWNELLPNIYLLVLNCVSYFIWGIEGLGVSFLVGYFFYFLQVYLVVRNKYGFKLDSKIMKICLFQFLICLSAFLIVYFLNPVLTYIIGGLLIGLSFYISLHQLEKKIDFLKNTTIRLIKKK